MRCARARSRNINRMNNMNEMKSSVLKLRNFNSNAFEPVAPHATRKAQGTKACILTLITRCQAEDEADAPLRQKKRHRVSESIRL